MKFRNIFFFIEVTKYFTIGKSSYCESKKKYLLMSKSKKLERAFLIIHYTCYALPYIINFHKIALSVKKSILDLDHFAIHIKYNARNIRHKHLYKSLSIKPAHTLVKK